MLCSASADLLAPLAHAAPYREPRKYEAGYRGNDDACQRMLHRSHTTRQADYPPVKRIVWHVTILCQSRAEKCRLSDVFDVFHRLQVVPKVTVLLRADVRTWPHRLAAHCASWATGGNHRGRFRTQVPRLLPRQAAGERGVAFLLAIEIVRDDDDAVLVIVVSQLHATNAELLSRLSIKLGKPRRRRKHGTSVRQAREHLFER